MAHRQLWLLASALCMLITTTACEDTLSNVGYSTRPESDIIHIENDTIQCGISTGYRDSIYVRTGYPLLGNITDPEFGSVKAGYLAQFYSSTQISLNQTLSDSITFDILRTSAPHDLGLDPKGIYNSHFDSLVNNTLDSLTLRIYYNTYYGDSLSPMKLSIYALNSDAKLEREPENAFYSNYDFSKYYSTDNLLGVKAYTAANRTLSDSARNVSGYMPYIEIRLSDELKDKFYRKIVEAAIARSEKGHQAYGQYQDIFSDIELMRENFLSGVAIQPTFGDGSIIKVFNTAIWFYYHSFHKYNKDGTLLRNATDTADSTYVSSHVKYMAVTPDVVQMSNLKFKDNKQQDRINDPDNAYITSPQGYYTTVDLPIGKIIRRMMDDVERRDSAYFLNGANFSLMCEKPQGALLSNTPAQTVLMVEETKMNLFFEQSRVPSNSAAAVGTYKADSISHKKYYYSFGNLSTLIAGMASEKENGAWDKKTTRSSMQWAKQIKAAKPQAFLPQMDLSTLQQYSDADYESNRDGIRTLVQNALDRYSVRMAVIPVEVTTSQSSSALLSVSNYILPTAIKVQRDTHNQFLQFTYTLGGSL